MTDPPRPGLRRRYALALGIIGVLTAGEYAAVARLVRTHRERSAALREALVRLGPAVPEPSLTRLVEESDAAVTRIQQAAVLMTGASLLALLLVGALILEPMVQRMDRKRRLLEDAIGELRRVSALDGLTGVLNRRSFDERLAGEWRRAGRDATWIAVLMVDIDHFKPFNDCYGHQEGDACLRRLARTLKDAVARPGDFVARYGGEEFAVVLPDTDLEGATQVGETLRAAIERLGIPHSASGVAPCVTISVGAAATVPNGEGAEAALVAAADRALYRAKQGGRNRVEHEVLAESMPRSAPRSL